MKKLIKLTTAFLFAFVLTGNSQNLTLEEILTKHFETTGTEKLSKIKTIEMDGKIITQGIEMPFVSKVKAPGKLRTEVTVQGNKMIQAYDGKDGWMVAPWTGTDEPQDINPDQLKQIKDQADFTGKLWKWKDKVQSLELVGKEDMEGTEVYKLKMVDKPEKNENDTTEMKDGDVTYIFIDAENFVILKMLAKKKIRGAEMEFETYQSNYKDKDGILMPFSIKTKMKGKTITQVTIANVQFNLDFDDSIFERPKTNENK